MSTMEHEGPRSDRQEYVGNIPENYWTLDVLLDLFLGLWDHGYQVHESAEIKLLRLACNPKIKPLILHPKDLAFRYVTPGTYDQTFRLVREMRDIGMPAKEICQNFFRKLKGDSKEKTRKSLEILKGSELEKIAKPIVEQIL